MIHFTSLEEESKWRVNLKIKGKPFCAEHECKTLLVQNKLG
jgi:hypothetical protein